MDENARKISINYILNLLYQLLLIIIPIITTPYLSRVLLADGIGEYSYLYSIITYFILLSAFGFLYYSQRVMIKFKDDLYEKSRFFWEIILLRIIFVVVSILGIFFFLGFSSMNNKTVMLFMAIEVVACGFDISFLYQANENYKIIVFVHLVVKTLNVIAIFIFVKTSYDLGKYALIQSVTVLLSNVAMWLFLKGKICFVSPKKLKIFKHFLPCLYLFVPTVAIAIYRTLDKTLIGVITQSNYENAIYEQAEKIVRVLLTIITSLGSVMLSRNSNLSKDKDFEQIRVNIFSSLRFVMLLSLPMIAGVCIISNFFIPFFLGDGYEGSILIMKIYSVVFFSVGVSNVVGLQFFVALGKDKQYIISIVTGAMINLVLNVILINLWGALGATISTIIAETVIALMMAFLARKFVSLTDVIKKSWRYFVATVVMFIIGYAIEKYLVSNVFMMLVNVVLCCVIYILCLLILRDDFIKKIFIKKRNKV